MLPDTLSPVALDPTTGQYGGSFASWFAEHSVETGVCVRMRAEARKGGALGVPLRIWAGDELTVLTRQPSRAGSRQG